VTNLFDAALDGDTPQVQALLGEHPDLVNAENERKRTALHYAAREGHAGTVRVLLEAGADPNCVVYPNKEITNPRTLADARGHEAVVAVFDQWVEAHLPSTASGLGTTLCAAVRAHDRGRVDGLLSEPEAMRPTDADGNTALHVAAEVGWRSLVLDCLDRGADPDARNRRDLAPVHAALSKHPFEALPDLVTAGLLLGRGAAWDLWVASALGDVDAIERLAADAPSDIHRDHPSYPLTIAAHAGQQAAVRRLLDLGADPDAPRMLPGATPYREIGAPVHFATLHNHIAVVRTLLEAGANPNTTLMAAGSAPSSAYQSGFDELADLLFRHGGVPDTGACLARGNRAAVLQAFRYDATAASKQLLGCGDPDIVACCLRYSPQLTPREQFILIFNYMRLNNDDMDEARHRAAIIRQLLEYGLDPNVKDQESMSLLHRAVGCMWRGRWMNSQDVMIEFSRTLLDGGADINAKDDDLQSTPIAWHARYGHDKVVEYLLSQGAAQDLPDDEAWTTPKAWAARAGHEHVLAVLQAEGAS